MKKLLLLGLVLALFSCQEEPKIDYAIVSGQIENPTDKTVSLFQGREKITEMTLDQDGKFSDTLKIESGYYNLDHGREMASLYLEQGDDITVTLKHQPGVKDGTCGPGGTDIQVTFITEIQ